MKLYFVLLHLEFKRILCNDAMYNCYYIQS